MKKQTSIAEMRLTFAGAFDTIGNARVAKMYAWAARLEMAGWHRLGQWLSNITAESTYGNEWREILKLVPDHEWNDMFMARGRRVAGLEPEKCEPF